MVRKFHGEALNASNTLSGCLNLRIENANGRWQRELDERADLTTNADALVECQFIDYNSVDRCTPDEKSEDIQLTGIIT